jgi:hypothetical protein
MNGALLMGGTSRRLSVFCAALLLSLQAPSATVAWAFAQPLTTLERAWLGRLSTR